MAQPYGGRGLKFFWAENLLAAGASCVWILHSLSQAGLGQTGANQPRVDTAVGRRTTSF